MEPTTGACFSYNLDTGVASLSSISIAPICSAHVPLLGYFLVSVLSPWIRDDEETVHCRTWTSQRWTTDLSSKYLFRSKRIVLWTQSKWNLKRIDTCLEPVMKRLSRAGDTAQDYHDAACRFITIIVEAKVQETFEHLQRRTIDADSLLFGV